MNKMKVGIFSYPGDEQAQAVLKRANEVKQDSVCWFDLSLPKSQSYAIDKEKLLWNGVDVSQLSSAYIHGYQYQFPVMPRFYSDLDFSMWQTSHIADQQKYSFLASAFQEMERRGVRLNNTYRTSLLAYKWYDMLEAIRQAGFNVPGLLYTNDMEEALAFCEGFPDAVWRPGNGRATWQLFSERREKAPLEPAEPPVILAETKPGLLLRAFIVGGKPVLYLGMRSPHSINGKESLEMFWQRDEKQLNEVFTALSEALGVPFMKVTFVLDDKTPWIYDVDMDPAFHQYPEEISDYLVKALALNLIDEKATIPEFNRAEETMERPNIFSRGQLCILFNMESYRRRAAARAKQESAAED